MQRQDVAVIGAGIVGLSHAWSAASRGHRVTLFERTSRAEGASIRNFGMIWPIGQPAGSLHQTALRSRSRWLELGQQAGLWVNHCGSIHLAHRPDEWAVLEEFANKAPALGYECQLLNRQEVLAKTPAANPDGLLGGLYSPSELGVNPRQTIRTLPDWLAQRWNVRLSFGTNVTGVYRTDAASSQLLVQTAHGDRFAFDRVIVSGGVDVRLLFPQEFARMGLRVCKLQMLRTAPQPGGWRIGPHLASGLTLRHYHNFDVCPSLAALKHRIATETPELDQYGIHVMASQLAEGSVILGDSHEYDEDIEPFDKALIDELMLRELRKILQLPDWGLVERWHGQYAKHPTQAVVELEPWPGLQLCTGTGGAGMTMSFGLAEAAWDRWSGTVTG